MRFAKEGKENKEVFAWLHTSCPDGDSQVMPYRMPKIDGAAGRIDRPIRRGHRKMREERLEIEKAS